MMDNNPPRIRYHKSSMLAVFRRPVKWKSPYLSVFFSLSVQHLVRFLCDNGIYCCVLIICSCFLYDFWTRDISIKQLENFILRLSIIDVWWLQQKKVLRESLKIIQLVHRHKVNVKSGAPRDLRVTVLVCWLYFPRSACWIDKMSIPACLALFRKRLGSSAGEEIIDITWSDTSGTC